MSRSGNMQFKNKLIKVVAWRAFSITITFILLLMLTGDVKASSGVTILLHLFLTVAHFAFETIWENIYESR
jgi:uncharacterized membrane protein